jgi:predicted ATPase
VRLLGLALTGEYKGLRDQTFDFTQSEDGVIALIGLNGSGKSQLLELVAESFAYLERAVREEFRARRHMPFKVELIYSALDESANTPQPVTIGVEIALDGSVSAMLQREDDWEPVTTEFIPLPRHVVGYASGLNENLQRAFLKNALQYFDVMQIRANRRKKLEGLTVDEAEVDRIEEHYFLRHRGVFEPIYRDDPIQLNERDTPLPTLKFIDYDCAALLLASLSFQPRTFFDRVFPDIAHRYPHKLVIRYDLRNAPIAPDTSKDILQLIRIVGPHSVQGLCPRTNDQEYEIHELDYLAADIVIDLESAGLRGLFENTYLGEPIRFFEKLYKIQLLGIRAWQSLDKKELRKDDFFGNVKKPLKTKLPLSITELKLQSATGELVDFDDLSDGESQLIQTLGAAYLFGRNSLFLFDEPDTHLNPEWRTNFHKHLKSAMAGTDSAQAFVTTHSPFLISSLKKENVFLVEKNDNHITSMAPVPHETYGASFEVLIKQYFGLTTAISQTAVDDITHQLHSAGLSKAEQRQWIEQHLGESMEKAYLLKRLED